MALKRQILSNARLRQRAEVVKATQGVHDMHDRHCEQDQDMVEPKASLGNGQSKTFAASECEERRNDSKFRMWRGCVNVGYGALKTLATAIQKRHCPVALTLCSGHVYSGVTAYAHKQNTLSQNSCAFTHRY